MAATGTADSKSGLLARLAAPEPIVLDAAMGTALLERTDRPLDPRREPAVSWSLQRPEAVLEVHRAHVSAGAELLLANTFGPRPPDADELHAAIALAREAGARFIAVTLWPGLQGRQLVSAIKQAGRSGADLLWLETAMQARDAERALRIAKEECPLPVVLTLALAAFPSQLKAAGMAELRDLLAKLAERKPAALGLNCGPWDHEPSAQVRTLSSHGCAALAPEQRRVGQAIDLPALAAELAPGLTVPLALKPDAGRRSPQEWGALLAQAARAGAKLIGGCCGTSAAHLAALRSALHAT